MEVGRGRQAALWLLLAVCCLGLVVWSRQTLGLPMHRRHPAVLTKSALFKDRLVAVAAGPGKLRHQRLLDHQSTLLVKDTKSVRDLASTETEKPVKVVLVTYNRGGSTFLGETINLNPAGFYWFEPLAAIYEDIAGSEADYVTTLKQFHFKEEFNSEQQRTILNVIHHILNCSLAKLPTQIFNHRFLTSRAWVKSRKVRGYYYCMHGENRTSFPYCIARLEEKCRESRIRAAKVIRIRMDMVRELLKTDPTIKVIHYVRDPRGILSSRSKIPKQKESYEGAELVKSSSKMCDIMRSDLAGFRDLTALHPNSGLMLRYEDLAMDPEGTTNKLYNFIQQPVPDELLSAIQMLTSSGSDNGAVRTRRENSTKTALAWSEDLPQDSLPEIERRCRDVLNAYQYPVTHNQDKE